MSSRNYLIFASSVGARLEALRVLFVIMASTLILSTFYGHGHVLATSSLDFQGCDQTQPFEGFGVFLGSVNHFSNSPKGTVAKVVNRIYNDLGIRHFRTSYESQFSPSPNNYTISCGLSQFACTWIELMDAVSKYKDAKVFSSIWSPPHYMKIPILNTLQEKHEMDFYYFIKNITQIIKQQFAGLEIERVSPVNEPENLFAPWEHCNMRPYQLCRMVKKMNDSFVKLCPENSYFWMTELYSNYTDDDSGIGCAKSCEIYATHAYTLDIDFWSPNRLLAYYDPGRYSRYTKKPMWMTEVSSTYENSQTVKVQMREALDFSENVINFVGTTCVQRYYYWSMYTESPSGESLVWGEGTPQNMTLVYPKKYFTFRHFTLASFQSSRHIEECSIFEDLNLKQGGDQRCLIFIPTNNNNNNIGNKNQNSTIVLMNKDDSNYKLDGVSCTSPLCCTTEEFDWFCITSDDEVILPKRAVCSCQFVRKNTTILRGSREIFDNEI